MLIGFLYILCIVLVACCGILWIELDNVTDDLNVELKHGKQLRLTVNQLMQEKIELLETIKVKTAHQHELLDAIASCYSVRSSQIAEVLNEVNN